MERQMIWKTDKGWACSACSWVYPASIRMPHSVVRSAYDRLALVQYEEHRCSQNRGPQKLSSYEESFLSRMRMLVMRGATPADAVRRTLSEASHEYRNDPEMLKKARAEGDEFLRRIGEGCL